MGPGRAKVLAVVDDDQEIRRAVGRLLRSCGHVVHVFESAEAYLARDCDADCAILDVHLPGISGFELEGRLRQAGRRIPVVFITARDDLATRAAARDRCVPCLSKPFDDARLLDAIERATSRI